MDLAAEQAPREQKAEKRTDMITNHQTAIYYPFTNALLHRRVIDFKAKIVSKASRIESNAHWHKRVNRPTNLTEKLKRDISVNLEKIKTSTLTTTEHSTHSKHQGASTV